MFIKVGVSTINTDHILYIVHHENGTVTINWAGTGNQMPLQAEEAKTLMDKLNEVRQSG